LIPRYTRPEMGAIWTEENKYRQWLEVELAASEALAELGEVPREAAQALRQHADFDAERIGEIEAQVKHDVISFTTAVAEKLAAAGASDASRWLHYGLTSNDVVDTAQALQLKAASEILRRDLAHIGHSWSLCSAFLLTIPYLLLQAVPIWVLSSGYGFDLPVGAAIALVMLLRLAAAVPQAPATLGLFQLITKEFLEYGYAIPADQAARFSLLLWAVIKLPLLAAGAVALVVTGSKIGELTRAAEEQAREHG